MKVDLETNRNDLFNGNIGSMITTITNPTTRETFPLGNAYKYDQLNRLLEARSFDNLNPSTNTFGTGASEMYFNTFSYDANGNILTQLRKDDIGSVIDSLTYRYAKNGNNQIIQNRLYHVNDTTDYNSNDIDDMGLFEDDLTLINQNNNYTYTEIGELERDEQEEILAIVWRVDSKVKEVNRTLGSSRKNLKFDYDAKGNRIAKHVYETNNTTLVKSTYYLRDAQGNVMSVYEHEVDNTQQTLSYNQQEKYIYGSSRLGMNAEEIILLSPSLTPDEYQRTLGNKQYELSNHLGNVLTVITDKKMPVNKTATPNEVDHFIVEILSATDYSPFGVTLNNRDFSNEKYRYGFGSHEKIDEVSGSGNTIDMGDRWLDTRLGRTPKTDAKAYLYPGISPYAYAMNNPIIFIDPDGKKVKAINEEAKEIIRLGLTPEEAKYVKFNRKGMVKKGALNRGMRKLGDVGGNYEALLSLVKEKDVYEVEVGTAFEVHTVQGDPSTYKKHDMGTVTYSSEMEDNWEYIYKAQYEHQGKTKEDYIQEHPEFSTELEPRGLRGISLYSDAPGGHGYSASGNHRVVINATQTQEDQVENLGHELYGHEYFKSKGKNHSHGGWTPVDPNYNHELEHQIRDREKESKENYQKHQ